MKVEMHKCWRFQSATPQTILNIMLRILKENKYKIKTILSLSRLSDPESEVERKKWYGLLSPGSYEVFLGILERTCKSPVVNLPTLPKTASNASRVRPASRLLIPSEVQLDCELSYETKFNWNVYKLNPLEGGNELALSRSGTSELLITRRLLSVGTYLAKLTVSMMGTQVSGVAEGYIRVIRSPMIALISGGTKVERGFNQTLEFDGSLSRDPDALSPYSGTFSPVYFNTRYLRVKGCLHVLFSCHQGISGISNKSFPFNIFSKGFHRIIISVWVVRKNLSFLWRKF